MRRNPNAPSENLTHLPAISKTQPPGSKEPLQCQRHPPHLLGVLCLMLPERHWLEEDGGSRGGGEMNVLQKPFTGKKKTTLYNAMRFPALSSTSKLMSSNCLGSDFHLQSFVSPFDPPFSSLKAGDPSCSSGRLSYHYREASLTLAERRAEIRAHAQRPQSQDVLLNLLIRSPSGRLPQTPFSRRINIASFGKSWRMRSSRTDVSFCLSKEAAAGLVSADS